jgi:arginase
MDLQTVRERGIEGATRDALAHLERKDGPAGFWIHLDVDVLDDAIMPAVDYRLPGGLSWDELTAVLRGAVASDRAVGLEITIFNPTLDADGRIAHALVDARDSIRCRHGQPGRFSLQIRLGRVYAPHGLEAQGSPGRPAVENPPRRRC